MRAHTLPTRFVATVEDRRLDEGASQIANPDRGWRRTSRQERRCEPDPDGTEGRRLPEATIPGRPTAER